MRTRVGDGVFRHVNVRRPLSWAMGGDQYTIGVFADAEVFLEPGETPRAPCDFGEPLIHFPLPYGRGFTRAQWEEIKREGDAAFAEFDKRFETVVK